MPRAVVQFTCKQPGCDGIISETLWVSEPDYSAERMSDGDAVEDHDVTCPECETDYEVETVNGMGGFYATLDGETLSTGLEHDPEPDDYEDFLLNYVPANDTVGAFEKARSELLALLTAYQPMPASMMSRMIYSQLIATMEPHLSDKILKLATTHIEIKQRLAKSAGFVQGQTVKLSDILLDPAVGENSFKIGLQSVLYHDLEKVEKLYNVAFKCPFFPPSVDIKSRLEAAVKIRHDCVHRNGTDKAGTVHQFDATMIRDLARNITTLVDHLEKETGKAVQGLN